MAKKIVRVSTPIIKVGETQRPANNFIVTPQEFGAVGDGITNDTVAVQNAENRRANIGGSLVFGGGYYLVDGININRTHGGAWYGQGAHLFCNSDNGHLLRLSGAVPGPNCRQFTIDGLSLRGNGKNTTVGISEANGYQTTVTNVAMVNLTYAMILWGGRGFNISNIQQYGSGTWFFTGIGADGRVFDINITNVNHQSVGLTNWAPSPRWFAMYRAIAVNLNNVTTASLDGRAIGLEVVGACEGIFLNNVIVVYPTIGMSVLRGPDVLPPGYVNLTSVGLDQPTVTGLDAHANVLRLNSVNSTFGRDRQNTGQGIILRGGEDIRLDDVTVTYMHHSGLVVEPGVLDVGITGLHAQHNGVASGVDFHDMSGGQCLLHGKNSIGTMAS